MTAVICLLFALLSAVPAEGAGGGDVAPHFRMTLEELEHATASLSPRTRARIASDAKGFLALMERVLGLPTDLLVLVDKQHGLDRDFVPRDLVALEGYPLQVTRKGLSLRSVLMPDLLSMVKSARADGVSLPLSSTYRSYAYQVTIYERELKDKSREEVERELAPPGHSQHQLGTAIDFGSIDASFAATSAGRWLSRNAWKYGFSLSYPQGSEAETGYAYEPWHYRYVGPSAAEAVERFFEGSLQSFLEFYERQGAYFEERKRP